MISEGVNASCGDLHIERLELAAVREGRARCHGIPRLPGPSLVGPRHGRAVLQPLPKKTSLENGDGKKKTIGGWK
eukprot:4740438-Pyramimonas_sp.AAC.1